jgi:DNA topoisomerase-1
MVGYSLSNVVQRKLKAKSAGRVQSVALLFIVERFLEREKFVKSN